MSEMGNAALKSKAIIVLLTVVLFLNFVCLFFFNNLDRLVHYTLYDYGLQFSASWAGPYWANANLFVVAQIISIALLLAYVVFYIIEIRNRTLSNRLGYYSVLFVAILLNFFCANALYRIDFIVNHDLYAYDLIFSNSCAEPY